MTVNDKQTLQECMADLETKLKERNARFAEKFQNTAEGIAKLREAGIKTQLHAYPESYHAYVRLTKDELSKARQALGCPLVYYTKTLEDHEARTVEVSLHPKKYPNLHISYVTELKDTDPCQIHEETTTTHTLVCQRR